MNKSNLAFIVEDEQNNKFGYYLSTQIQSNKYNSWISTDNNTFLFSLKSNGRLNGMMKFEIKDTNKGYAVYQISHEYLIGLGAEFGIVLYKENSKGKSNCRQNNSYFDYHGTENPLVGGSGIESRKYFTPKRIIVIEMN